MILLSFPLWTGTLDFPRIPFLRTDLEGPAWLANARATGLLVSLGLVVFSVRPRLFLGVASVLSAWSILSDQERLQPWMHQFLLASLGLCFLHKDQANRYGRWVILSIYVFSGLSKIDISFTRELGPLFLRTALSPWNIEPWSWPEGLRVATSWSMPLFEISTAILLARRSTRTIGLVGSTLLHVALIGLLGPFGLRHSPIVLIWNAAILVEVWILFGWAKDEPTTIDPPKVPSPFLLILGLITLLPVLEPFDRLDPWPGHALYASHEGRLIVEVAISAVDRLPAPLRYTSRVGRDEEWSRLDLTAWSRLVRGVPAYPGLRANLGLAEWIATRAGSLGPTRVVLFGRAGRWSGERTREDIIGLDAIRSKGRTFFLNSQPAEFLSRPLLNQ